MKIFKMIVFGCLMLSTYVVSASASYLSCLEKVGKDCVFFFARKNETALYANPNETDLARWRATGGMALRIDWSRTRKQGEKRWAYVDNGGGTEKGWVRVSDIAGYGDFRRVIRCWPVASVHDEDDRLGDFMLAVEFNLDGFGRVTSENNRKVHVWFTDGLILIGSGSNSSGYVYRFDKELNAIYQPTFGYQVPAVLVSNYKSACSNGLLTTK